MNCTETQDAYGHCANILLSRGLFGLHEILPPEPPAPPAPPPPPPPSLPACAVVENMALSSKGSTCMASSADPAGWGDGGPGCLALIDGVISWSPQYGRHLDSQGDAFAVVTFPVPTLVTAINIYQLGLLESKKFQNGNFSLQTLRADSTWETQASYPTAPSDTGDTFFNLPSPVVTTAVRFNGGTQWCYTHPDGWGPQPSCTYRMEEMVVMGCCH